MGKHRYEMYLTNFPRNGRFDENRAKRSGVWKGRGKVGRKEEEVLGWDGRGTGLETTGTVTSRTFCTE
jgi:hypothetical protein